jgi:lambda family phage minor tail protein L
MSTAAFITFGLGYSASVSDFIMAGLTEAAAAADSITAAGQRLEVGNFVELYTLDITSLGGGVLYWTPARPMPGWSIVWQGNTYQTVDIKCEGFEKTTSGTLPRPHLTIGNADNVVGALLTAYSDVLGLNITRTRTLYGFLDGQANADPEAEWSVDIYRIERKVSQNKNFVVLELAAATDNEGAKIPKQFVLRDLCSLIYRRWNGSAFDYTVATCPYAGVADFDSLGNPATDATDVCGKRVSDCKLRFGAASQLPFGGFPGVARVN